MAFLNSLDISGSALTAQRLRMDIISQNLANATTTRTADGGPYRRRAAVFTAAATDDFATCFSKARHNLGGVVVSRIVTDMSDLRVEYDPEHPDADSEGYVHYPNVDEVKELIDMMAATRAYESNITALNATKNMALKALEIGK